jgi:maltose phosphorylase
MNKYIKLDPWKIIEEGFKSENVKSSESLFSLGNGYMGQRANFEERYSGDSMPGNYIAGIYYPDRTKVGYWKVGYPEYFAKIANSANWIGIDIEVGGESLDLAKGKISGFVKTLHMDKGYLERTFTLELPSGKKIKVNSQRFLSLTTKELGAVKYSLTPLNFSGKV